MKQMKSPKCDYTLTEHPSQQGSSCIFYDNVKGLDQVFQRTPLLTVMEKHTPLSITIGYEKFSYF